jgi:hypothetical protein
MPYRVVIPIDADQTGIVDWRAQLKDQAGADVGTPIAAGFVAVSDDYVWDYDQVPDVINYGQVIFTSAANPDLRFESIIYPDPTLQGGGGDVIVEIDESSVFIEESD